MSHSVLFFFLLVVVGLSTVYSQKYWPCNRKVGKREFKGGWGGICFGDQNTLAGVDSCESIVHPFLGLPPFPGFTVDGCPWPESCCVDCNKQTDVCHKYHSGSKGMNDNCNGCPDMWRVGKQHRERSGCFCCKDCKRKDWCRRQSNAIGPSRCVTDEDPRLTHSVAGCDTNAGWRVILRGCQGNGCHCCIPPKEE